MPNGKEQRALSRERWWLLLGRNSDAVLQKEEPGQEAQRRQRALEFLYDREQRDRGARLWGQGGGESSDGGSGEAAGDPPGQGDRSGASGSSVFDVPRWLLEVRTLFPRRTVEVIERHALERYGMKELVTDPEVLAKLEPNVDLVKSILALRHLLGPKVLPQARAVVRKVVREIAERLAQPVRRALGGKKNRNQRSPLKVARNLNWRRTIAKNLKNYDSERGRLVVEDLFFHGNVSQKLPWDIVLCVDQSASMADSVIYSAVLGGVLAALPGISVKLIAFDTEVADLSAHLDDPVELLMSVQLGGGTDIAKAMGVCEEMVEQPSRTVLVLISDFYEGGSVTDLLATCRRLKGAGVRLLGLGALDRGAEVAFDRQMAARLAAVGMEIAALTPEELAKWLAHVIR